MKTSIFHAYDIRGIYPTEINPEIAYRIGWAFAKYLKTDLKLTPPIQVVLGMDMRGSSPFLAREIIRGLNEQGIDVAEIGKVSTPAFYHAVAFKNFQAGIMATASHQPKQYNGFKITGPKAFPIAQNTGIEKIKEYFESSEEAKKIMPRGKMSSLDDITRQYVLQELSYINPKKLKKLKIAADPANCMGATYLDELFKLIPVDLIKINWDLNGNMPAHEANPIKPETLKQLQAVMQNENADFGIATDGDGDRIAFLDEKGDAIPSSIVCGLVAKMLLHKYPGSRIAYDLRFSRITREMIEESGGEPIETIVGHSFIKALMKEKDVLFSGELSGHYYFRENFNLESPVFVALMLLTLRSLVDKPFSEIWRPYLKYFHSGEINFSAQGGSASGGDVKERILQKLEKKYPPAEASAKAGGYPKISKLDGLKVDYPDWWFNVRPSANDPVLRLNLEANTEEMMKQKLEEISKEITS